MSHNANPTALETGGAQAKAPAYTVVIIGALPQSLINFRGDLIRQIVAGGHRVIAMATNASREEVADIKALGAEFRSFPVERSGINPVSDLKTFFSLVRAYRDIKPDIVIAYTVKPVVWSGLALRAVPRAQFYALITGLGFAYQGDSLARRTIKRLVSLLYKTALARARAVIFQNSDNRDTFTSRSIVARDKCHVVAGSGVNLETFSAKPFPDTTNGLDFLLVGRMLGEKGVREYVDAARIVRARYSDARFQLVGPMDPSLDGIKREELQRWQSEGVIAYHGATNDVREYLAQCHIYVLPSYHEGMPRSVLEAMATGRPILTTDVAGCKETVVEGVNGFLVPPRDAPALAQRMMWCIENADALPELGAGARKLAETHFDVRKVNTTMLEIIGLTHHEDAG